MLYYSEILNKKFVTEEECKEAEAKFALEKTKKEEALKVKAEDAKKVEEALQNVLKVRKEANKTIAAAEEEYLKLRDEFVKKYGSWHYTITDKNGETVEFTDTWTSLGKIFSDFFNF